MSETEYNLQELVTALEVSARTVRYYIAEGLLPPPVAAGPNSTYTVDHVNRLKLIAKLKEAYLPLREIRRQLNDMTEEEIAAAVATMEEELIHLQSSLPPDPIRESSPARSYIDRALEHNDAERFRQHQPPVQHPRRLRREHEAEISNWTRIAIDEEIELLVRDDAYRRKREDIEWLVTWARKVFRS